MEKYYLRKCYYNYEIVNEEDATLVALSKEDFEKLLKEYKAIIKSINYWTKRVTEKANSERRLSPAKHHSGYVLLQSNPYSLKTKNNGKNVEKRYYETILQTPYLIDVSSDVTMTTVLNDLKEKEILEKVGLTTIKEDLTNSEMLLEKRTNEPEDEKVAYNLRLRINGYGNRWDLVFNHLKVLNVVPWELRGLTSGKDEDKSKKNGDANSEAIHEASEDAE